MFSLSLSLTSLLSRPVLIQGSIVGSPDPHSHLRVGRGFNGGGLSRREGRFHLSIHRGFFSRVLAAARGEQPRCGSRLPDSLARRLPGFRKDQRGPFQRLQIFAPKARRFSRRGATDRDICGDNLVPLIPARLRKTSGALIVTVAVTVQGAASFG